MHLREYIYTDIDKVKAISAQLDDGTDETTTIKETVTGSRRLGSRAFGELAKNQSQEVQTERSLIDALFSKLEADLESQGILTDLSQDLQEVNNWTATSLRPARMIRVTSQGRIFHSKVLTDSLASIATAAFGIETLSDDEQPDSKPKPPKGQRPREAKPYEGDGVEAMVVPGNSLGIPRNQIIGLIRAVRGMFPEGLHLVLQPTGDDGPSLNARLEEGRRYLDSDPLVLSSRYGFAEQEWTIVGLVGHQGQQPSEDNDMPIVDSAGNVQRSAMIGLINQFLTQMGTSGLIDLPAYPGATVVPLAVYRTIYFTDGDPTSTSMLEQ